MSQPEPPTNLSRDALLASLRQAEPESDADAARVVRAPGRVNLIGEHTDYNDGLVLPVAIDLEIRIALLPSPRPEARVRLLADGRTSHVVLDPIGPRRGEWYDYVAGTAREMAAAGLPIVGFDGVLASSLPSGSGLSSSAALELASAWALSPAPGPPVEPLALARIAQRAENEYVGVRCGLMDQFASACGVEGSAVLLDCRSLEHRAVPLPAAVALVVIHTGMPRSLSTSAYNDRRADCERAVTELARHADGVRSLRDVDEAMLERYAGSLDDVALRRARHVVAENLRVLAAEAALREGDLEKVGRLFASSHASLRDRYEVSSPELDALVEIAASTPGVVASRMTGAGFGGCTVNLMFPDAIEPLRRRVETEYATRSGRQPQTWVVRAVRGAGDVLA